MANIINMVAAISVPKAPPICSKTGIECFAHSTNRTVTNAINTTTIECPNEKLKPTPRVFLPSLSILRVMLSIAAI